MSERENAPQGRKTGVIERILKQGQKNATTAEQIRARLHMTAIRDVHRQIYDERQQGAPILSTPGASGYFLPSDGAQGVIECRRYVNSLSRFQKSVTATLVAFPSELLKMDSAGDDCGGLAADDGEIQDSTTNA